MNVFSRCASYVRILPLLLLISVGLLNAEPLPLKRAVQLALTHSTTAASATADEQHAFASYHETRNTYLPQLIVGSGLGASWGFPLTLEGSAPSLVNVTAQSFLINPAQRQFLRAAKTEWAASKLQGKDQRNQVIQDTVLSYAELNKWEQRVARLQQNEAEALKMEKAVTERVQEGVDSPLENNKARLSTARVRLHFAEARGAADVLRRHLSQLTGLPLTSIETVRDSIPTMPNVTQTDDLASKAAQASPMVQAAERHATAQQLRAKGEHRALLPAVDFAAQYALLTKYNNYDEFYLRFQRHNASLGVAIRFPFLNPSQHAHAQAADAEALKAQKEAEAAKNKVSEETLKLQRSVEQLSAARDVADLEYQVTQSGFEAAQTRIDAGTATLHDLADARTQADERFLALQDATFELERARINLLRSTGDLEKWALGGQ